MRAQSELQVEVAAGPFHTLPATVTVAWCGDCCEDKINGRCRCN